MKIAVTGCDRSGTTLMHVLFGACFRDVILSPKEIHATEFDDHKSKHVVTKKTYDMCHLGELISKGITVVMMVRDPRDVITSKMFLNGFKGYWQREFDVYEKMQHAMYLSREQLDEIVQVRYEHLVMYPDSMQKLLAERLGLETICPFSDFTIVAESLLSDGAVEGNYIERLRGKKSDQMIRPIDPSRVGRWKREEHRAWIVENAKIDGDGKLQSMLEFFGYEKDTSWLIDL